AAALNIGDALTDMIMGGFGAVLLTGGNGKEAFGNWSNAVQFASGSDKIDLTAFGALTFETLALTPTSTSVPAHTIAWLLHGATNETVVYVNSTDQPLGIGGSGLAEIHLQGVSSVQSSDFILAPASHVVADSAPIDAAATTAFDATIATTTNTDVLSIAIDGDGALLAEASSTTQTTTANATHVGYEIDAAPDKFAWIEARTDSIEQTADDTVITVPSGHSVGLPQVALIGLMETGFAFDQKPLFDSADATPVGHDAVMHGPALQSENWILPPDSGSRIDSGTGSASDEGHGASSQKNLGLIDAADAHDQTADFHSNPGDPKASENDGGDHSISREAGEHGAPPVHGAGIRDVEPSSIDVDSNPGGLKASENGVGNH
ncbi:MAG TPA: hypothetical protein VKT80_12100, partial [Chloroflexota bacterium]|nr:hypothetical protein [Chloroflexota bacterium]